MRIGDDARLVAEEILRVEAQRRGERALEIVLVIEVAAAEVIVGGELVIDLGQVLGAGNVVVGVKVVDACGLICVERNNVFWASLPESVSMGVPVEVEEL